LACFGRELGGGAGSESESKVDQADVVAGFLFVEEDIGGFEVAVNDVPSFMDVTQHVTEASNDEQGGLPSEASFASDPVVEGEAGEILEEDEESLFV